jgi:nitrogen regulatory protein P-II 2
LGKGKNGALLQIYNNILRGQKPQRFRAVSRVGTRFEFGGAGQCPIRHGPFQGHPCQGDKREKDPMKFVMAVIKPFKLDDVRNALTGAGVHGLTVTEAKGFGRQKGHTEIYRGAEYTVNFLPKLKIEVAVASDQVDTVVAAIVGAAKTGQIGDGKIFVMSLDHAVRIRTGETDETAL